MRSWSKCLTAVSACTLREDLLAEVANLAREDRFDYLLIESTGISEPAPVADTFTFAMDDDLPLSEIAELDTMVTVIDAANFLEDLQTRKRFKEHRPSSHRRRP